MSKSFKIQTETGEYVIRRNKSNYTCEQWAFSSYGSVRLTTRAKFCKRADVLIIGSSWLASYEPMSDTLENYPIGDDLFNIVAEDMPDWDKSKYVLVVKSEDCVDLIYSASGDYVTEKEFGEILYAIPVSAFRAVNLKPCDACCGEVASGCGSI